MVTDKELKIELAKNRADEFLIKKELDDSKRDFIKSLNNGLGKEIRSFDISSYNVKQKIKTPFGKRTKMFFGKIKKIIGF